MVKMLHRGERGCGCKFKMESFHKVRNFTAYTPLKYGPNPKQPGSKSYDRYKGYMKAATVGEALHLGSKVADLLWELERGDYKLFKAPKNPPKLRGMTKKDIQKAEAKLATIQGPQKMSMSMDTEGAAQELAREEAWQKGKLELCRTWAKKLGVRLETETFEDLREDGVYENAELRNCRLVADALAKALLEERREKGKSVTDADVTEVLRIWGFAQNAGRLNVLPGGRRWVYSDTLGGIKRRTGGYGITPPTRRYPNVTKILNQWLLDNRPAGLSRDFVCTSININANYGARTHRDGNNVGPSAIRAFGSFKGGELRYWDKDDKKSKCEQLDRTRALKLNIKKSTAVFDGNLAHAVEDFSGERISVVFFSCRRYHKVGIKNIAKLKKDCGFNWPTDAAMAALKKHCAKKR